MPEINISATYAAPLQNVLTVLEKLNRESCTLDQEEIKKVITDFINYRETTSDFRLLISQDIDNEDALIHQLCDLYQYLKNYDRAINSIEDLVRKYANKVQPKVIVEHASASISVAHQIELNCIGHVLEITPSYIVIEGNKELILLDKKTYAVIKTISIDFYFSNHYKHPSQDHMLFYHTQDMQLLFFVDLVTGEQKIISVDALNGRFPLSMYAWDEHRCMIVTENQKYWMIDTQPCKEFE